MPTFFCKLCKQSKDVYLKYGMLLFNPRNIDTFSMPICSQCFFKLHTIRNSLTLTHEMKQQSLENWNLDLN